VEFDALPVASGVCALTANAMPANSAGYYCTNPGGSDFPTRASSAQNASLASGQAGSVSGGVHPGDFRVMVALDYALSPQWLVGIRVGLASDTYPGQAAVLDGKAFSSRAHLEARATYVFGDAPLAGLGFAPLVFAGAGAAEFDGHATAFVTQATFPGQQPVVAWKTAGPAFVAAGVGVRYQFSRRTAFTAAVRLDAAFGGSGTLLPFGPEIAFQYGL
jgi:hypothetical protein